MIKIVIHVKKYISARVDSVFYRLFMDLRDILKIIWRWYKDESQAM